MRWTGLPVLALGAALLFTACAGEGQPSASQGGGSSAPQGSSTAGSKEAYHKISAEEAKEMMDAGGVTVVDVRREDEYKESHIPGAVLVPVESIGDQPPAALPEKEAVLLVHCRTGVRSKRAAEKLVDLGYQNVYDFGGIVDWPYETESGEAG